MKRPLFLALATGLLACGGRVADAPRARDERAGVQLGAEEPEPDEPMRPNRPEPLQPEEPGESPRAGCGSTYVEHDCDERWSECGPGTHRDFVDGACSTCVPDDASPRTCEWARGRYQAFLSELIEASCAAALCDDASDCPAAMTITNRCATDCVVLLNSSIDEEIIEAAQSFSDTNCSPLCASTTPPACEVRSGSVVCVNHRCVFESDR